LCDTTTSAEPRASAAKTRKISFSIGIVSSFVPGLGLQPAGQVHRGDRDQVEDGERQQHLPAEPHELVIAEARERPAHPDEEGHGDRHLGDQRQQADDRADPSGQMDERQGPAAEEERHAEARERRHVGVLRLEEQGEAHGAVLGVEAGHQLRLRFRQVERQPVRLGERGDQEDEEADELGDHGPHMLLLVGHHVRQIERADRDHRRQHRQGERQLVADHLRRGADRAHQGEFVVRAVAGEHKRVDAQAGERQEEQHARLRRRDDQRNVAAEGFEVWTERDHHEGGERRQQSQGRSEQVEQPVGGGGRHVLFEHELERVGDRLEEAHRTDPVRARAVLDQTAGPALHPVHDRRDVDEHQEHHAVLGDRREHLGGGRLHGYSLSSARDPVSASGGAPATWSGAPVAGRLSQVIPAKAGISAASLSNTAPGVRCGQLCSKRPRRSQSTSTSGRSWPGGGQAASKRCTRFSTLTNVPDFSTCVGPGSATSATLASGESAQPKTTRNFALRRRSTVAGSQAAWPKSLSQTTSTEH